MTWVGAMLLGACSFSGPDRETGTMPEDSSVTDSPTAGPDAMGVDASTMNDAMAVDAKRDSDGDGHLDEMDNCVDEPNAEQWDEDADGLGDVCDPCPQVKAAQTDTDNDGVGNDCDPRPTTPGDELVFFEGFHTAGAGLPSGWSEQGGVGTWSVEDDSLVYRSTTDGEPVVSVVVPGGLGNDHTADTTGRIDSLTPGSINVMAVLTDVRIASGNTDFFHCAVRADSNGEVEFFQRTGPTGTPTWMNLGNIETPSIAQDTDYRIVSRVNGNTERCIPAGIAINASRNRFVGTRVGYRVRNASATFRYLAVYRSN